MVSIAFSLSIEFDSDLFTLESLPTLEWVSWENGLDEANGTYNQEDWHSCHLKDTASLLCFLAPYPHHTPKDIDFSPVALFARLVCYILSFSHLAELSSWLPEANDI